MTRIIGGSAGGRRLKAPGGERTRPTSDLVREALFSSLDSDLGSLTGLRFLDLYAGSGAVGLEARSRGAGAVTLVEQDRRTAAVIKDNIRVLGLSAVEVVTGGVERFLLEPPSAPYDVVFLDPPYPLPGADVTRDLAALQQHRWVAAGSVVVVERSRRSGELVWPTGFVSSRAKRYGETTLWYGHASEREGPADPSGAMTPR